jgi:hypothetical protein
MKLFFLFIFSLFIIYSCKDRFSNGKDEFEKPELTFLGMAKIDNREDSAIDIIAHLNASEDLFAVKKSISYFQLKEFKFNGYVGFMPSENGEQKQYNCYVSYRLSEYIGNLDKEKLSYILNNPNLVSGNKKAGGLLGRIEKYYLAFNLSSPKRRNFIDSLSSLSKKYPQSLRIKYLLANCYYSLEKFDLAGAIWRDLIEKDYYRYNCLRRMIQLYARKDKDSSRFYINYLQKHFPQKCNIDLLSAEKQISKNEIEKECNKCLTGLNQRDSMNARLFIINNFLDQREYSKVDSSYHLYASNNDEFVLDSFKLWEKGEYYDVMLRKYFVQEKYKEFVLFTIKNVGYNTKIKVEDEQDLYNLVKGYHKLYFGNPDEEHFRIFFIKHFGPVKRLLLSEEGKKRV